MLKLTCLVGHLIACVKNVWIAEYRNAEIVEREVQKTVCGVREMECGNVSTECGNVDAEGCGFNLYVAPSFRNQLSLICR